MQLMKKEGKFQRCKTMKSKRWNADGKALLTSKRAPPATYELSSACRIIILTSKSVAVSANDLPPINPRWVSSSLSLAACTIG
eukprot:7229506-Pyramimonas_sp.AAC.1